MITLPAEIDKLLLERDLFTAIERFDLPRDQVNLLEVCKTDEVAFGKPGSDKREQVRARWKNVKRSTIRNYVNFLLRLRVTPSRSTKLELENFRQPSPFSTVNTADGSSSSKAKSGGKKDKLEDKKLEDDVLMLPFENLSINDNNANTHPSSSLVPTPQKMTSALKQSVPTTIQKTCAFSPPRKDAATASGSFGSPAPSFAGSPTPSLGNSSMSTEWTEFTVGTSIQNPIPGVLDVYGSNPEELHPLMCNRPGKKDDPTGRWEHEVVTLQREVSPCDLPHHKMWLKEGPNGDQYIVTQEPSMTGVFHTVAALYAKCPNSDQAKIAFETKRKIDADPSRQFRYRSMLVRGCKLDNSIFSGDGNNGLVKMEIKLVPFELNGFQVKSTVVEWTIALVGDALEKLTTETNEDDFSKFQAQWNA